jgi:hypothetical protein
MLNNILSSITGLLKPNTQPTINKVAPKNKAELQKFIGDFKWAEDTSVRGAIKVLNKWDYKNIVLLDLPFKKVGSDKFARIQVHKLIKDNVVALFNDFVKLNYHVKYPIRVMGGYVPRHMYWDPKKPLSIHSYGIAIDLNWDTNPAGNHPGDMPKYVVDLFKAYGWTWGGDWKALDRMHLQFYTE